MQHIQLLLSWVFFLGGGLYAAQVYNKYSPRIIISASMYEQTAMAAA